MKTRSSILFRAGTWLVFLIWLAALWYLSSLPGGSLPAVRFPHADKVMHFGYFFLGGAFLWLALKATLPFRFWRLMGIVFAVMAGIGLLDEYHQTQTPHRSGNDWGDLVADCAGGLSGAFLIGWIYVRRERGSSAYSMALPGDSKA